MRSFVFTAAIFALLFSGCSSTDVTVAPPPEELFRDAQAAVEDGDYEDAVELLDLLREEYPFSPLAIDAELLEADSLYADDKYNTAAKAYSNFESFHPFHPRVDYAIFRQALCYSEMVDSEDRDQMFTKRVASITDRLLELFPNSTYKAQATELRADALNMMAEHELYVAKFYLRTGEPISALGRLQTLLALYPDTEAAANSAELLPDLSENLTELVEDLDGRIVDLKENDVAVAGDMAKLGEDEGEERVDLEDKSIALKRGISLAEEKKARAQKALEDVKILETK